MISRKNIEEILDHELLAAKATRLCENPISLFESPICKSDDLLERDNSMATISSWWSLQRNSNEIQLIIHTCHDYYDWDDEHTLASFPLDDTFDENFISQFIFNFAQKFVEEPH